MICPIRRIEVVGLCWNYRNGRSVIRHWQWFSSRRTSWGRVLCLSDRDLQQYGIIIIFLARRTHCGLT
jgi:hypothetical protein